MREIICPKYRAKITAETDEQFVKAVVDHECPPKPPLQAWCDVVEEMFGKEGIRK